MVVEASVVAGYVIAWVLRKARRVGEGMDGEVDLAIDAGLERLHGVVAARLGADLVLENLDAEASTGGQVSERTRQQVERAITAAACEDDAFGQLVTDLVVQLKAAEQASGISVVAGPGSRIFTGETHVGARGGGIAIGLVGGDVYAGGAADPSRGPADPPGPGRPRG